MIGRRGGARLVCALAAVGVAASAPLPALSQVKTDVPQTIEGAFAQGAREMIVVLPDSRTAHNGSMYSSSETTGDLERFIARELVASIDSHRTLAKRESRGLVGHSMGGYGATRIGMKLADVFGILYIMSPCGLSARGAGPNPAEFEKTVQAMRSPSDFASLPFFPRAQLAVASAWSPNPKNPPLLIDLPTKDGVPQPDVLARWGANAPLAFGDQYIGALRRYRAIAIDVGDQDRPKDDTAKLHNILSGNGIGGTFEIYVGPAVRPSVRPRVRPRGLTPSSLRLCRQTSYYGRRVTL